ncbi:MAG: manganese transporter, partial [Bacteroidetes bacterium]
MNKSFLFSILLLCLVACAPEKSPRTGNEPLYLVTTTGMLGDAVARIAGEHARVEALMGPGVDPHLYKATPGDLSKLREADMIFYNGLHLEG